MDKYEEYLIERGYHQYPRNAFDNEHIAERFQKRFDDDFGKKYFINVRKWSNDYIPISRRNEYWKPFSYDYEVQISVFKEEKFINFEFFADWTIDEVEKFMEDFFETMKPNYYESWNGNRGVKPE